MKSIIEVNKKKKLTTMNKYNAISVSSPSTNSHKDEMTKVTVVLKQEVYWPTK